MGTGILLQENLVKLTYLLLNIFTPVQLDENHCKGQGINPSKD